MILKKVIIFLLIFTGLVITSNNCHAKDLIQWKSYVVGIQPPTGGQELPSEQALQGASVSILNYPSIRATTDSSGMFVLYGIPSNQVHYFKVSKEGYVRTNTAVKMPDFDVDSTVCFSTSQQPCVFPVRLVAVSQEMIGFLQQTAGYTDIDLQRYGVVALPFSRAGEESYDINTQTVLVSINDGDPLTPDRLIKLGDVLIIPNIPPGEARIRIENVDNATIPLITLPVFLGEITIYPVEIVDQSQMGTVKGNVKNEAGDNLPGAIVEAIPEGMQGRYATTTTDANGNYTLNLIQGVYKISAKAQGYARQFYFLVDRPDWASQIWVEPGRTFENINFTLYQAKTITGKVIDSATKSPIPNAWVNAYSQSLMTGAGEATNQNGEYTLVLKPASDYIVSAQAEGYAPIFYNQKVGFNEAD
ncbi:MAG: carboxypeptidase-like regulatory domain-containing protein, partial [Thermoplasmatales archaeon]